LAEIFSRLSEFPPSRPTGKETLLFGISSEDIPWTLVAAKLFRVPFACDDKILREDFLNFIDQFARYWFAENCNSVRVNTTQYALTKRLRTRQMMKDRGTPDDIDLN
jgi:hypothetical protein